MKSNKSVANVRTWKSASTRKARISGMKRAWANRRTTFLSPAQELQKQYKSLSEGDIAWAAGLFEGEGCITQYKNHGRLIIHMTDKDVLVKFHKIMGGNLYGPRQQDSTRKPIYTWQLMRSPSVVVAIRLLLPHFGIRRTKRANKILRVLKRYAI